MPKTVTPIYFYPRSPCGERLDDFEPSSTRKLTFLSTLSLRRATLGYVRGCFFCVISIHALLAESDQSSAKSTPEEANFYPRSPCGERLGRGEAVQRMWNFYPRSPCGERHLGAGKPCNVCGISIHALLAESDLGNVVAGSRMLRFLSTLSLRRATE